MPKKLSYFSLILAFLFVTVNCSEQKSVDSNESSSIVSWSKNLSIYEVNVRQFSEEGTFNAFKEHLPRLKELGVGILWLMPINPIGELNRKGSLGSYYSVKDYKGINPEFGTKKDFRELVEEIHKQGMYVIIDWVANHTSWDHEWTETNPEFYTKDSLGNFVPPVADWSDVIDLNYDNRELRREMIDALIYWVKEFNIDGYRCDVAGEVPVEFWNEARKELNMIKPIFMLAEAEETAHHEKAFDMSYAWDLHHIMNEVAKGKANANDLYNKFIEKREEFGSNAYRMNFTTNHDENSWNGTVFERMQDAAEVMAVLTYTIDGMPLIYSGQEAGLSKRLEFFESDPIEWKEHKFASLYKNLNELKMKNKALWNGNYGAPLKRITTSADESVFAFMRSKEGDTVFTLLNLSDKPLEAAMENNADIAGRYINYFTGENISIDSNYIFNLPSWNYKVLLKKND